MVEISIALISNGLMDLLNKKVMHMYYVILTSYFYDTHFKHLRGFDQWVDNYSRAWFSIAVLICIETSHFAEQLRLTVNYLTDDNQVKGLFLRKLNLL